MSTIRRSQPKPISKTNLNRKSHSSPITSTTFTQTLLTVLVILFSLNLALIPSRLALHPLFGSTATNYHFNLSIFIIDVILLPILNLFLPSNLLPTPVIALTLSAFFVQRAPQIFSIGLGQFSGRFGPKLGPIYLQSAVYWPIRLIGMLAAKSTLERFWNKKVSSFFSGIPYSLTFLEAVVLPGCLHVASRSLLPYASSLLEYFPPCQIFSVASRSVLGLASLKLASQALKPKSIRVKQRQHSLIIFILILIAYLLLPGPKSLCEDVPSNFNKLTKSPNRILARRQSVTGLVIVAEHTVAETGEEFRYLRCDHSLLGGLWTGPTRRMIIEQAKGSSLDETELEKRVTDQAESIYATFVLQEAIRLVKRQAPPGMQVQPSLEPKALVIGLGVGSSARNLMRHQIKVTVIEIDPIIYDYALRYFGMSKPNGGIHLEDAREFVRRRSKEAREEEEYDYIIHDVFTGGSVPASVFTLEFWWDLSRLLRPDGVLAVNFAGEPLGRAGLIVIHTLMTAFPFCRIFTELQSTDEKKSKSATEFQNLVIFCQPGAIPRFRKPTIEDALGSEHRLKIFKGLRDQELKLEEFKVSDVYNPTRSGYVLREVDEMRSKTLKDLEEAQVESAIHHWSVMREVLDDQAWANYY